MSRPSVFERFCEICFTLLFALLVANMVRRRMMQDATRRGRHLLMAAQIQ